AQEAPGPLPGRPPVAPRACARCDGLRGEPRIRQARQLQPVRLRLAAPQQGAGQQRRHTAWDHEPAAGAVQGRRGERRAARRARGGGAVAPPGRAGALGVDGVAGSDSR
ncbi:unnamed protein product, partial [Prorocentrum cordatum]